MKLYGKYEKLINLMEVGNFDIDSVCNLIYIQAETIDLNDYYTTEKINELFKEGKIKGYILYVPVGTIIVEYRI